MSAQNLFQSMITFLNFPEDASIEDIRHFLQGEDLCHDKFIFGDDEGKIYSLYTKAELATRTVRGERVSLELSAAAEPAEDGKHRTLLIDPTYYRECVIFPDADGGAALRQAFRSLVSWFQTFMLGCSAGVLDVATLNKYRCVRALVMEFQQTKNTMNPVLSPVGWRKDLKNFDGVTQRMILSEWIYPFVFTANGEALSKIRRCRQCGTFFKGIRLSAIFCTTKCRMAWNYAHRG